MELSRELISNFAKITAAKEQSPSEVIVYGTAYKNGENYFVKLDGAADGTLTPVSSTVEVSDGERVTVMIKNHAATITGNFSEPAAKNSDVMEAQTDITKVQTEKVDKTKVIESVNNSEETALIKAERIDVEDLFAKNITATGNINFNNDHYELSCYPIDPDPTDETEEFEHPLFISSRTDGMHMSSGKYIFVEANRLINIASYFQNISLEANLGEVLLRGLTKNSVKIIGDVPEAGEAHPKYTVLHTGNTELLDGYVLGRVNEFTSDYVVERGSGGGDSSISWKYRKWKSGAVELWGRRSISDRVCNTLFGGGMYRTSLIEVANFPFDVYYPNVQVSYEPSNGYGAFVWPYSAATTLHPASYYLMRPTIPDTNLAGYLNFYVRGSLVE